MNKLHLHLPNIPRNQKMMDRAAAKMRSGMLKTKNPFAHLSASISASHKRKLARSPKPKKFSNG